MRNGVALLHELDAAMERIMSNPERWPLHLKGTRRLLLRRFPYGVIYRVRSEQILIVAIAHTHRAPGYWANRL